MTNEKKSGFVTITVPWHEEIDERRGIDMASWFFLFDGRAGVLVERDNRQVRVFAADICEQIQRAWPLEAPTILDEMAAVAGWARTIAAETDEDRADASREDLENDLARAAEWAVPVMLNRIAALEAEVARLHRRVAEAERAPLPPVELLDALPETYRETGAPVRVAKSVRVPVAHPPPEPDLEPAIGDEPPT